MIRHPHDLCHRVARRHRAAHFAARLAEAVGGAQARFGVTPDLATFGKALGNGFPCSALLMMKKAAELQSKMQQMQAELETLEIEGTSGGGGTSGT